MRYDDGYQPYVPVAEKKAKAEKKLKDMLKKNPGLRPVRLVGSVLAKSWWGKAWNRNLERYADYQNRIGRGRSYVRHGAVLDLQIGPGEVRGLVQGSARQPYQVVISFKPLAPGRWQEIKGECQGKLNSLSELMAGNFPSALQDVFMREGAGLFPSPKEIRFNCNCLDWASMCKHVAAVLYGVGARLDEDPSLFFTLRQLEVEELISEAVRESTARILEKTAPTSDKVIKDADLSGLFGISMELATSAVNKPLTLAKGATAQPKRASLNKVGRGQGETRAGGAAKKPSPKTKERGIPAALLAAIEQKKARRAMASLEKPAHQALAAPAPTAPLPPSPLAEITAHVLELISEHEEGIAIDLLCELSGCPKTQLYGIVHRLKVKGEVKSLRAGVYVSR